MPVYNDVLKLMISHHGYGSVVYVLYWFVEQMLKTQNKSTNLCNTYYCIFTIVQHMYHFVNSMPCLQTYVIRVLK